MQAYHERAEMDNHPQVFLYRSLAESLYKQTRIYTKNLFVYCTMIQTFSLTILFLSETNKHKSKKL